MKTIESNNGIFEIHSNYIISRYNNNADLELDEASFIINMITENFTCDFGWISDRVNSYSFNPLIIPQVLKTITNLKCFASITYNDRSKSSEYLNNLYTSNVEIRQFNSLPSAIKWIETII